MAKIKAASVAFGANGDNMSIVDQDGNLWVKYLKNADAQNGEWQLIELPEKPQDTNQNRVKY